MKMLTGLAQFILSDELVIQDIPASFVKFFVRTTSTVPSTLFSAALAQRAAPVVAIIIGFEFYPRRRTLEASLLFSLFPNKHKVNQEQHQNAGRNGCASSISDYLSSLQSAVLEPSVRIGVTVFFSDKS